MTCSCALSPLVAEAITVALTNKAYSALSGLDGMTAVTLEAVFIYGSGGTSVVAKVQTSLDGTNWRDIARFDFAAASATKSCNISGLTPIGVQSLPALSAEGVRDGFLGGSLRAVVTSVGIYGADTMLAIRAATR